jgi:hypothetical protein
MAYTHILYSEPFLTSVNYDLSLLKVGTTADQYGP